MNIKCDKCNNEFFVRLNPHTSNSYTVKCPVCKNPITIKFGLNDSIHNKRNDVYNQELDLDKAFSTTNLIKNYDNNESISDQSESYKNDTILNNDNEFYNNEYVSNLDKKDNFVNIIRTIFSNIKIYRFIEVSFYYVYYAFMLLLILTFLFLFSEGIKLNHLGFNINNVFHSIVNVLRRYV